VLAERGIVASLSRKGDCWDDAVAESFFATVKAELSSTRRTRRATRGGASVGFRRVRGLNML